MFYYYYYYCLLWFFLASRYKVWFYLGDLLFFAIQCYCGICVVKWTALLWKYQYGNLVLIRPAMYSLNSTKNRPVEVALGSHYAFKLDEQRPRPRLWLLESYWINLACSGKTLQHFHTPLLYLFAPTEYLTARPRPAPALTDGQPWNQHSHPAGPAFTTVQLCHHSGSIHQQTDRVSRRMWN